MHHVMLIRLMMSLMLEHFEKVVCHLVEEVLVVEYGFYHNRVIGHSWCYTDLILFYSNANTKI